MIYTYTHIYVCETEPHDKSPVAREDLPYLVERYLPGLSYLIALAYQAEPHDKSPVAASLPYQSICPRGPALPGVQAQRADRPPGRGTHTHIYIYIYVYICV